MSKKNQTELTIQGFFIECDNYDRAVIMFLDDYDGDFSEESFTKKYMLNRAKYVGKNPLTADNTCFNVKLGGNKVGFIDNIPKPIEKLKQHKVSMNVLVNAYIFKQMGEVVSGWNIKLVKMDLLD